ncbi:MAG: sugar transferase [bacterium]
MKRTELAFTVALVPIDFLLVLAASATAYNLRYSWLADWRPAVQTIPQNEYLLGSIVLAAAFVLFFSFAGLYSVTSPRRLRIELTRIFLASSTAMMAAIILIFFRRELFESRFIALAVWALAIIFVGTGRIIVRLLQRLLLKYGVGVHRVAIVYDDGRSAETLESTFRRFPVLGFKVVAAADTFDEKAGGRLDRLARAGQLDEIIAVGSGTDRNELSRLLAFARSRQLGFRYTADLLATQVRGVEIGDIAGLPVVEIHSTRLDGWGRIFKRTFDVIVSAILLVLISPILLVTAIAIKLDSKGTVFFSRLPDGTPVNRIGENGHPFRYIKFRSMQADTHFMRYNELAEQNTREGGPLVKIKNDPRVTRVGRFIRKFSIDELPELFLVLKGDMSLVGPRPHLPEEVAKYEEHHRRVFTVKPGITGLAQVSGRADLSFEDEIRLDTYYIENWSPWLDLSILLKTPFVVLFGRDGG